MANKRQRIEKKKLQHQQQSKKRVMMRRQKIRAAAKAVKEIEREKRHFAVKSAPIRNQIDTNESTEEQKQSEEERKTEWIKQRLEHNMKILEALEAEMQQEEEKRKSVNESLEKQGAVTMRQKLDLIGQKAEEMAAEHNEKSKGLKFGGNSDVACVLNPTDNQEKIETNS